VHLSLMQFNETRDDGQAESDAAVSSCVSRVGLSESLKELRSKTRIDADALVNDRQFSMVVD
jgi:hypothetical protein